MERLRGKEQKAAGKHARYGTNLKLKQAREHRGWAQADVANKIGAQTNLVTRWERGNAFPSPYYRQKLCGLFEATIEELGLVKEEIRDAPKDLSPGDVLPGAVRNAFQAEKAFPSQLAEKDGLFSRRHLVLGLAGGIAVGGIAGITWWQILAHRAVSPPVLATHSAGYTYQTHPPTGINDVRWSPRGTFIACVNGDKTIQILNARTGSVLLTYRGHTAITNSASWSPDEARIASASADTTVQIWNPTSGTLLATYRSHSASVWCVAWSPDGSRLASGGRDSVIHVWEAASEKQITTYRGHSKGVWTVAWSPDSQNIASCSEDGTIQVWEATTGRKSPTFAYQGNPASTVWEVGWSPDGKRLASANADTSVQIWDALTGSHLLTCQGHTASVQTVKWSSDGQQLASGGQDKTVRIWNAATGTQIDLYAAHRDVVYAVSWSPDNQLLASGSNDTTMQVHQVVKA